MNKRKKGVLPNMKALEMIRAYRAYLDYLERHIVNVGRAWVEVQEKCEIPFIWDEQGLGESDWNEAGVKAGSA